MLCYNVVVYNFMYIDWLARSLMKIRNRPGGLSSFIMNTVVCMNIWCACTMIWCVLTSTAINIFIIKCSGVGINFIHGSGGWIHFLSFSPTNFLEVFGKIIDAKWWHFIHNIKCQHFASIFSPLYFGRRASAPSHPYIHY